MSRLLRRTVSKLVAEWRCNFSAGFEACNLSRPRDTREVWASGDFTCDASSSDIVVGYIPNPSQAVELFAANVLTVRHLCWCIEQCNNSLSFLRLSTSLVCKMST